MSLTSERLISTDGKRLGGAHLDFRGLSLVLSWSCAFATALLIAAGLPVVVFLATAILWGWSEADGACGRSHIAMITPLRNSGNPKHQWLHAAMSYTGGGTVTALVVGCLLGFLQPLSGESSRLAMMVIGMASLVLVIRELGLIRFNLPQIPRQTNKLWAWEYGVVCASAMWGAHIGLGFFTVIRHGGFIVLVPLAIMLGPKWGATLFATYWVGRTLPVWLASWLVPDPTNGAKIVSCVIASPKTFQWVAATALVCASAAIGVLFIGSAQ